MNRYQAMTRAHHQARDADDTLIFACIEAYLGCLQTCTFCADACLAEPDSEELSRCIRLNLHCAAVCAAAARVLIRLSEPGPLLVRRRLEVVSAATLVCAEECEWYAGRYEHCRICAETCVRCAQACAEWLEALTPETGKVSHG